MQGRLITALLVLILASAGMAQTGQISIDPDSTYFQKDSLFVVTVTADANLRGVKALQLDIDVNPLVIRADTAAIQLGNMFVDNDSITFIYEYLSTESGRLTVDIAVLGGTDVVNGPGEILKFPFRTIGFGVSDISISGYRIRDSLNQAIVVTTDTGWVQVCRHVGDVNGDNVIDIGDLTYLINFILSLTEGPPVPYESGNVDCVDIVDIGDITRLIDYLFISFEPLCARCL